VGLPTSEVRVDPALQPLPAVFGDVFGCITHGLSFYYP
jgi:hypothetical protein